MDAEELYQKGLAAEAAAEREERISHQQAGILRDQATAFWKDAAEQGDADAQYELGFLYGHGLGTLRDIRKSRY